jgi:hypothetical protein
MTGGPLFVSSGDATADQHYGSALQRAARGDLVGATEILAQTVKIVPAFATAWFALGAIRDSLGDRAGARFPRGRRRAMPIPTTTMARDYSWRDWARAKVPRQ